MMKSFFTFMACVFVFLVLIPDVSRAQEPGAGEAQGSYQKLQGCMDQKLGVRFLCNPDWILEPHDGTMLIIISADPAVTMTVAKTKPQIAFIEQLTNETLQQMGQYADGFTNVFVKLAGLNAVRVDGYSKSYPDIQVRDFYVIHGADLYSVLFSVDPKERWQDYQTLFEKIASGFEFLPSPQPSQGASRPLSSGRTANGTGL